MKSSRRLTSLKSASGAHIRSIPNAYRSRYLDLFIRQKEKEKLEQETDRIKERLKDNLRRLEEIQAEMTRIEQPDGESDNHGDGDLRQESPVSSAGQRRSWQTVKVKY